MRTRRGFTLIELLLAIGIIAVLSSIVIGALSPTRQLASSRDAKRQSDINTIVNAVYQYTIDNRGNLPQTINSTERPICQSGISDPEIVAAGCVDLDVLTGAYLVSIPVDPQVAATGTGTRYAIRQDSNGRITVRAYGAEEEAEIVITR